MENTNTNSQTQEPEPQKQQPVPAPAPTPAQQAPAPPATTSKVAPLSIKIFAALLLLAGLNLLLGLFASLIFIFSKPLYPLATLAVFLMLEKTAIDLYKLKEKSIRNFYITAVLYALYLGFSNILLLGLSHTFFLVTGLTTTVIVLCVLVIPFFTVTRKGLPAPSTNPKRDNKIIFILVVVLMILGALSSLKQKRETEKIFDNVLPEMVLQEIMDDSRLANNIAPGFSCDSILTPQLIQDYCDIETQVSLDTQQSNNTYCSWTIVNDDPNVPQIIRELGGNTETVLEFHRNLPLNVGHNQYKEQMTTLLGTEAKIEEQPDVGIRSFSISVNGSHELIFRSSSKSESMRLVSNKCKLWRLKEFGRNILRQL